VKLKLQTLGLCDYVKQQNYVKLHAVDREVFRVFLA